MQRQIIEAIRAPGMALAAWIVLSMFSSTAFAQNGAGDEAIGLRPTYAGCVDHRDGEAPAAALECTTEEYKYQEERLDKVYKNLMASLDKARQKQLEREEGAWLRVRKAYCNARPGANRAAVLKSRNCNVYETAKRAAELEYIVYHVNSNP
ncbi:MAG: lysozyme inhibitor LprI family protein [Desulfovibrionaceae bacterium]|jgi:uncharacterized protein YecT (DUF1311 family)|nr:lysozyme inhibitor LprI family protein [Desulfovibrionaceae bacterium]